MRRALERRLARIVARIGARRSLAARERDQERDRLALYDMVGSAIRAGLRRAGIDPAEAVLLRRLEPAASPPRATPPLAALGPREKLFERLRRIAESYRDTPPDPRTAPPAVLLACYGLGEAPAW